MLMKEMLFPQSSETYQQSSDSQEKHYDRSNAALVIGVVLMLIGAFLLLDRFIPISIFGGRLAGMVAYAADYYRICYPDNVNAQK